MVQLVDRPGSKPCREPFRSPSGSSECMKEDWQNPEIHSEKIDYTILFAFNVFAKALFKRDILAHNIAIKRYF